MFEPSVEGGGEVFNDGTPKGPVPAEFYSLQGQALARQQLIHFGGQEEVYWGEVRCIGGVGNTCMLCSTS